jgi:hypothetical protein
VASRAPLNQDLLIVDDTRLVPDQVPAGQSCVSPPTGRWPTAAELDTFLYARGYAPWRCYPAGTLSPPGIFDGYVFDTLGTRGLPGAVVPLQVLANYRHVVWITDAVGASNVDPPTDRAAPTTAMRYMNEWGRACVLKTYIAQGGEVWLVAATGKASMVPWDKIPNNSRPPAPAMTWSFADGELVPGRFVYDVSKWRSEFKAIRAAAQIQRQLGRWGPAPPPEYASLPAAMERHGAPPADPLPPNRTISGNFYYNTFDIEYLSQPNAIVEDVDPGVDMQSTLDTLYAATGATLMPPPSLNAVMTVYNRERHPHLNGGHPVIHTGFDLWSFKRAQCSQLVDVVLQELWGLQRDAVPRAAGGASTKAGRRPGGGT